MKNSWSLGAPYPRDTQEQLEEGSRAVVRITGYRRFQRGIKNCGRGWRDGSVVVSTCHFPKYSGSIPKHQHISSKPSTTPVARRHHHVHSTQNTHSGPHTYTQNEIKGTMERTMVRDGRELWSATAVEKLQSEYWRGSKRLPKVTGSLRLPNTSSSGL